MEADVEGGIVVYVQLMQSALDARECDIRVVRERLHSAVCLRDAEGRVARARLRTPEYEQ